MKRRRKGVIVFDPPVLPEGYEPPSAAISVPIEDTPMTPELEAWVRSQRGANARPNEGATDG